MAQSLAETLQFVGSTIGVKLVTEPGEKWRIESNTVYFGEQYYPTLGGTAHDRSLFATMLLLDVWTVYRLPKQAPRRMIRRRAIEEARPEFAQVFKTIDRLESVGDILTAFPSLRSDLAKLFNQHISHNLHSLDLTEQWLLILLLESVGEAKKLEIESEVAGELSIIKQLSETVVAEAITPVSSQITRFERLNALILPGYIRLLKAMQKKQGLTSAVVASGLKEDHISDLDFGSTTGELEPESEDAKHATEADSETHERESSKVDTAEGADLFESTGAASVTALLDTPIATTSPQMLDLLRQIEKDELNEERRYQNTSSAESKITQAQYQSRANALAPQIEQMLNVWRSNLAKQISPRMQLSRQLQPEGEVLDETRLPQILAEALAGVARPRAFRPRERKPRRRLETAHTDYVMIIDRSSSMRVVSTAAADAALVLTESLAGFMRELKEIEKVEGEIGVEIRTALIVFDSDTETIKNLSAAMDDESRFALYGKVRETGGTTNDAAALQEAARELGLGPKKLFNSGEKKRKRVVIMLSDGHSSDLSASNEMLHALRSQQVEVWGIGVRDDEMFARYQPFFKRVDLGSEIVEAVKEIIEISVAR
ncbi:MAG TPA: vWA domain-containing protein [Microbacteriaceae bacterium]|nr:vWA domain-containing protein [Microbacteriaceae bacterium]